MEQAYLRYAVEIDLSGTQVTELMRAVLARGSSFRVQARGTSMFPFILDGDVVTIAPLDGRDPDLGMVTAYLRLQSAVPESVRLVVHRLVEKTNEGCVFLGDNQSPQDAEGPVTREYVLGAVASVERQGKRVRFGLGPERLVIALGARAGLLMPAVRAVSYLRRRLQSVRSCTA